MTERVDCHSHSAYSGHGSGSVADMVHRAEELGLATFAQTEHLVLPEGMDPDFETSMAPQTMERYLAELHEQRERLHKEGSALELVIGIEADWLPGRTDELIELCEPFEYVLGSVHFIDARPIDDSRDLGIWDDYGADGLWRAYFDAWLDMAAHPGPIMCFSHPDLPKKFGWRPSFDAREYNYEMAQAAARSGRMVEVNTAGLRNDANEAYPTLELLRSFHDAGVACTIGSDAHGPKDVAANFDDAVELMGRAGYRKIVVPTSDGDRRYVSIDDEGRK